MLMPRICPRLLAAITCGGPVRWRKLQPMMKTLTRDMFFSIFWTCLIYYICVVPFRHVHFQEEYVSVMQCDVDDEEQNIRRPMLRLGAQLLAVLKQFNQQIFLCYETLLAAMIGQPLFPWAREFHVCVLYGNSTSEWFHIEELLSELELRVEYDSRKGVYSVKGEDASASITLFEEGYDASYFGPVACRKGWQFVQYSTVIGHVDLIPLHFVSGILPTVNLAGIEFPVPHDGAIATSYLVPDIWWRSDRCSIRKLSRFTRGDSGG